MTQTGNYELNQWAETDRIQMEDFNSDNEKIDAALKANADAVALAAAAAANAGNCKLVMQTYNGTGTYGSASPNILAFSSQPVLLIIISQDGKALFIHSSSTRAYYNDNAVFVTWSGTSVSWYSNGGGTNQFNENGKSYRAFAFYVTE